MVVGDSAPNSQDDGPGFASCSGHLSYCIIPVSREFTHSCSRWTKPTMRVGRNKEQLCAVATTDKILRFTGPEPGNSQHKLVSGWGYRNGRSASPIAA